MTDYTDAPRAETPSPSTDFWAELLANAVSAFVVFLVALPLCIGIAVAVGVSPAKALISGIVGGIVVGFLSGSPLQVTGPAAGLFILVADQLVTHQQRFMSMHPGWEQLAEPAQKALEAQSLEFAVGQMGTALLICGAIQLAAGRLGLGQWFRAVSPAVVHGMLAGIGVLIIISQLHVMFDHEPIYQGHKAHGGLQHLLALPDAFIQALSSLGPHMQAGGIGLISVAAILLWQRLSFGWMKLIPGALLAVIAATAVAAVWQFSVLKLQVPTNLLNEFTWPSATSLQGFLHPSVVFGGLMFALVASAESLLCATAVDQMHSGERTNYDQELVAQGVGNFLCGIFGALPLSGVIVRSSANVLAGATSRWSTILHGFWLLLFVVALPMVLGWIPKACLGAILVYTGFQLIKWKDIQELWELDRTELGIYAATAILVVVEDLLVGVAVGITLSALKLLYNFSHLDFQLDTTPGSRRVVLHLRGAATFLRLPMLAQWLARVPDGADLHVDLTQLNFIDHACLELLTNWAKQHERLGGQMTMDWESLHARFRGAREAKIESYPDRLTESPANDRGPISEFGSALEPAPPDRLRQ